MSLATGLCIRCTMTPCGVAAGDYYFCCEVFICALCRRPTVDTYSGPDPHASPEFHFRPLDARTFHEAVAAASEWRTRAVRVAKYYLNHGSTPELQTVCRAMLDAAKREDAAKDT